MEENLCLENSVVVRIAKPSDLGTIYDLVDNYINSEDEPFDVLADKTKLAIREMVYIDGAMLFEFNGEVIGGIAGFVSPCMFNDEQLFNVMFFYIKPEWRALTKRAIKEIELCLLPTRTGRLIFGIYSGPNSEILKRWFFMMGYKELDTHFYKTV